MKLKHAGLFFFCLCLNAVGQTADPFGANVTLPTPEVNMVGAGYTDESWASHRLTISLKGGWRFAVDPGNDGMTQKWYATDFSDAAWQVLNTGQTWKDQGVDHSGWGWYRQQIFVPKDFAGTPLELQLMDNPSDDDTWFNGVRVGGVHGEYKYENMLPRVYTVPASLIHYGELNSIAIRIWGGNLTFIGEKSEGLAGGVFAAVLDPYGVMMRDPGGTAQPAMLYDLSEAQHGKPFEIVFQFPGDIIKDSANLQCDLRDYYGFELGTLTAPVTKDPDGVARGVVKVDAALAEAIYLRGRFKANLVIQDGSGQAIYRGVKALDHLSFASRDGAALPALPDASEDTPYGKLKLVDQVDCSLPLDQEPHPYMQSGFDKAQMRMTPGSAVNVTVDQILGKPARESDNGWFAYRVGRGQLKPHTTYLLRVEYVEDKPRYCPIEIQTGHNYMDVGWQNGVSAGDVYDPWPLSNAWQFYDSIVSLDDNTVGAGGTGSASAQNGFWVYFMNKVTPNKYYSMYDGGPAIASMRLYEIDPEQNAPAINLPKGLPQRTLMFDWERQADAQPGDLVRYAKLMGYSTISPIVLKWSFANWSDPLNGYESVNVDDQGYWAHTPYDPAAGKDAVAAVPGKKSIHELYLEATKQYGINYVPRFEYGGSLDLPENVRAIDKTGKLAKPDRFGTWCGDLLDPATWDDLQKLMDHMAKPYVQDNPQFTGMLWRIRCDRMPISYRDEDIQMFAHDTGNNPPGGSPAEEAAWASGPERAQYDDWWLQQRAQFHDKLEKLLQSYRPDLKLYYFNWDEDKFGLILPSLTSWAFNKQVAFAKNGQGKAAYLKDREERAKLTGQDYVNVMHSGNFTAWAKAYDTANYAMRPELYKDIKGVEIFAPADYLCYANDPLYLNYFQTADGLAVSNCVPYDEIGARTINPKYEGNMVTPGGAPFSMAFELMSYFHGDARTLTYTVYTYGRGFADAHRRFAQAFRALPAIDGTVVDQGDPDLKVRTYTASDSTYVGVAYKALTGKKLTIKIPGGKAGAVVTDLVTNQPVAASVDGNNLVFDVDSGPMELNAFLVH